MLTFSVSYEIVTPESAEHGDVEERGFLARDVPFREAWDLVYRQAEGGIEADLWPVNPTSVPTWFTFYKTNYDYRTGAEESRSLHLPDNITPSSALRIARMLGIRVGR